MNLSTNQLAEKICSNTANYTKVKVYFKDTTRLPLVGKFIESKEFDFLLSKNMARFCAYQRIEQYEVEGNLVFTRIIATNSIKDIITVNE